MMFYSFEEEQSLFDEMIEIPEKALLKSDEMVKIDARFLVYHIRNAVQLSKGLIIIHNHFSNHVFSNTDILAMEKILKVSQSMCLSNLHFMLFENATTCLVSKHFQLQDKTSFVELRESITYA